MIAAGIPAVLAIRRATRAKWAREQGIPRIMELAGAADIDGAFTLAREVERAIPKDRSSRIVEPVFGRQHPDDRTGRRRRLRTLAIVSNGICRARCKFSTAR